MLSHGVGNLCSRSWHGPIDTECCSGRTTSVEVLMIRLVLDVFVVYEGKQEPTEQAMSSSHVCDPMNLRIGVIICMTLCPKVMMDQDCRCIGLE